MCTVRSASSRLLIVFLSYLSLSLKLRCWYQQYPSGAHDGAWYSSFSFTQLDAGDPKRCFSFVLTANADDIYEVDECPDLDEDALDRLLKQLNESDDLSAFMMSMRRAFSATV